MSLLDIARSGLGGVVALAGLLFMGAGALGVLRFPDFYTRLHAVSTSLGPGATLVVLGLAIAAPSWAAAGKLMLLTLLTAMIAPLLSHFVGSAAYGAGLTPVAGPQSSRGRQEPHP